MKFDFGGNKHLIDLYTKGASRKYKFIDKGLAKIFVTRMERIQAAASISDLFYPASMRFESLEGREDCFSIRINLEYRIELKIDFTDSARTTGTVLILDVTKHYE